MWKLSIFDLTAGTATGAHIDAQNLYRPELALPEIPALAL